MPNGELCLALWASVTLPIFQHLVTKRWTVLPSGTLFLPKSFLHSCCVRRTDFYPLLRSVASSWIHIGVKRISQACCLHHLKNVEKKFVKHDFGMKNKKGRFFFWSTFLIPQIITNIVSQYCCNFWGIYITHATHHFQSSAYLFWRFSCILVLFLSSCIIIIWQV